MYTAFVCWCYKNMEMERKFDKPMMIRSAIAELLLLFIDVVSREND